MENYSGILCVYSSYDWQLLIENYQQKQQDFISFK